MADIELVVKIPEEIYKASQIIDVKYEDVVQIPLEVIANGTPLPKGHGRLIDADDLDITTITTDDYSGNEVLDIVLKEDVDNAPTIIEADKEYEVE